MITTFVNVLVDIPHSFTNVEYSKGSQVFLHITVQVYKNSVAWITRTRATTLSKLKKKKVLAELTIRNTIGFPHTTVQVYKNSLVSITRTWTTTLSKLKKKKFWLSSQFAIQWFSYA